MLSRHGCGSRHFSRGGFRDIIINMTNVSDSHSHTIIKNGKRHVWFIKRLWKLTVNLPVFEFDVSSFKDFDDDIWFGDRVKPTVRKVLEHHQKVLNANCSYPIILSEDGVVMDGVHRICRAYVEGKKSIPAVRFEKTPEPDQIL
jgi:hypothetical protein